MTNTCIICGKEFETTRKRKVCCSPACAQARMLDRSRLGSARRRERERNGVPKTDSRKAYDADGRHRRFRERAMRREPWRYEFADAPELL